VRRATATAPVPISESAPHRFTVAEYYRIASAGVLGEDDRVELIDGQILVMSPISPGHAYAVDCCNRAFSAGVRG
jgi:Uma2 family endonuclease